MRYFIISLALIAVAAASAVANLTSSSLRSFVEGNDLSLIAFIAPWCSFCHELYPEYEAAATRLESEGLALGRVDCDADKELCTDYQIPIYPTIYVFHNDQHSIYNGKRKAEAMVATMKRHNQPVVTRLSTAQRVAEFSTTDRVTVVGYFDDSDVSSSEVFTNLAESYRSDYLFGFTTDEQLGEVENIQKPSIIVYKTFDEGKNIYREAFEAEGVTNFLVNAATPLIQEIGVDINFANSANYPLIVIFAEGPEQRKQLVEALRPVAESTREELFWIIVDPIRYPEYAPRVALQPGEWPAFGIEDQQNDFRFAFPKRGSIGDIDQGVIRQVIEDFMAKKLESSIRSEPLPENQDGPVTVVVASSYEEEVRNSEQDVLMLFYSPTCKHCKNMAPDYEQLAESMKPIADKLKVAQIDAMNNDVWPRVESYPTIKLFAHGSKDTSVAYEGNRSTADFVRFLRENASRQTVLALETLYDMESFKPLRDEL